MTPVARSICSWTSHTATGQPLTRKHTQTHTGKHGTTPAHTHSHRHGHGDDAGGTQHRFLDVPHRHRAAPQVSERVDAARELCRSQPRGGGTGEHRNRNHCHEAPAGEHEVSGSVSERVNAPSELRSSEPRGGGDW